MFCVRRWLDLIVCVFFFGADGSYSMASVQESASMICALRWRRGVGGYNRPLPCSSHIGWLVLVAGGGNVASLLAQMRQNNTGPNHVLSNMVMVMMLPSCEWLDHRNITNPPLWTNYSGKKTIWPKKHGVTVKSSWAVHVTVPCPCLSIVVIFFSWKNFKGGVLVTKPFLVGCIAA